MSLQTPFDQNAPEGNTIPVVVAPPATGKRARDEQGVFTRGDDLDHSLRTWAARGGLVTAALIYAAGLASISLFLGLWPGYPAVTGDKWHIVVSTLVALFSVPTVILLAILRSASAAKEDQIADSVHEAVGQKVLGLLDKAVDALMSK